MNQTKPRPTAARPTDMPHIGDTYFPAGLPTAHEDDANPLDDWTSNFVDPEGKPFTIAYTAGQVLKLARKNFNVFTPFVPLLMTPLPQLTPAPPLAEDPKAIAAVLAKMDRKAFNQVIDHLLDLGAGPRAVDVITARIGENPVAEQTINQPC